MYKLEIYGIFFLVFQCFQAVAFFNHFVKINSMRVTQIFQPSFQKYVTFFFSRNTFNYLLFFKFSEKIVKLYLLVYQKMICLKIYIKITVTYFRLLVRPDIFVFREVSALYKVKNCSLL